MEDLDFIKRIEVEIKEVKAFWTTTTERFYKLVEFIASYKFNELTIQERQDLIYQRIAMSELESKLNIYVVILEDRLLKLKEKYEQNNL